MRSFLAGHRLAAVLAATCFAFAPAVHSAEPQTRTLERYKVVLQVSDADPGKWNLALNNARNIQEDLGRDNVDIEIVVYGPGLPMLKSDSKVTARLAEALDRNVALLACMNTMHSTKTTKADMYDGIGYVQAGVVHIMQRERQGWAYVRP